VLVPGRADYRRILTRCARALSLRAVLGPAVPEHRERDILRHVGDILEVEQIASESTDPYAGSAFGPPPAGPKTPGRSRRQASAGSGR
jgi:hypothetical protein